MMATSTSASINAARMGCVRTQLVSRLFGDIFRGIV
jgi:hypothetical protein